MLNRKRVEGGIKALFFLCGLTAVGAVLFISVYLVFAGVPAIQELGLVRFVLGDTWNPQQEQYGILPFLLTSMAGTGGAVLLGVPVGVLTALFLAKTARPGWAKAIRAAVALLAGIPSVVYGLVGMVVLVPAVQRAFSLPSGANLLSAVLVLSVMILPSIVRVAETALRAVPREYEEASLALGATPAETMFRVSLPAARSGVATAGGHGHHHGVRQRGQPARRSLHRRALSHHGHRLRDELCPHGLPVAAGPVFHWAGAVLVHHAGERGPPWSDPGRGGGVNMEGLSKKRRLMDGVRRGSLWLSAGLTCGVLALIIGCVLWQGLRHVTWELLSGQRSYLNDTNGILPNILNTLYIILLSMAAALPLGVGAAVYLTEYARGGRWVGAIEFAAETLSGLPSILFGLVGMLFFVRLLGFGTGTLAGGLTLVVMILPVVMRTTQESLKTVPQSYREGALGLGAGQWRMVRTVVLPNAADGIVTGCILAVGRIVGESAALLFTAGASAGLGGFFRALYAPSATLSVSLYVYVNEYGDMDTAMAIAAVLMVITLLLNLAAAWTGRRLKKRKGGR